MERLTVRQRHKNMAAICSKDTKPEMIVRCGLWKRGFRYRLNHKRLPGHPDLVLRKYRTCIFVNGCFWHGHLVELSKMESSACCKIPTTNHDFWEAKIRINKEREKFDKITNLLSSLKKKGIIKVIDRQYWVMVKSD